MNLNVEERVKQIIGNEDEYIIGFAHLAGLLPVEYGNHNYAIVIGKKLDDRIIDSIESGPTLEYLQHYYQVNRDLTALIHRIANELKDMNISGIAIEPTVSDDELDDEYFKTLRVDVSHKMAATRAGLGWIGKTALFVSKKFGPRLRLATILTNHPLECENTPINESKCGNCKVCVEKCPAQAANGKSWNINVYRDEFYNPFKCREKCLELSWHNMKQRTSICGICVSVCPVSPGVGGTE
ncbi:MAG: epoxyqueuosine reductase [Candidatus Aminicenantes bacterium]|nr:MAG: epoxyqueuosine reductase [Candidatus Aminicenantes bacterium]